MTASTVLTARAPLLDMDGTLVNSDAVVERVWHRWADRHGLHGGDLVVPVWWSRGSKRRRGPQGVGAWRAGAVESQMETAPGL